jgi:hypothetical protein
MGHRAINVAPIVSSMGVLMAFRSLPGLQWPEASVDTGADGDSPASSMP